MLRNFHFNSFDLPIYFISRYGPTAKTADIKNRLGLKKSNKDSVNDTFSKLHSTKSAVISRSSRNNTPSATKMKSDILLAEKQIPIQKRLTLQKDKSRSINLKQSQKIKSVFKRIG